MTLADSAAHQSTTLFGCAFLCWFHNQGTCCTFKWSPANASPCFTPLDDALSRLIYRWTAIQTALLFIHFDWNRFIYIAIDRMMYLNNFIYSFNHFVSLCWKWMNYKFWPIVCDVCKWVKVCEEKFGIPVFGAALLHRRKLLLIHSTTITRIVSLTLSLSLEVLLCVILSTDIKSQMVLKC